MVRIFTYMYHKNQPNVGKYHKNQPNVGKYTSPMDGMGTDQTPLYLYTIWKTYNPLKQGFVSGISLKSTRPQVKSSTNL